MFPFNKQYSTRNKITTWCIIINALCFLNVVYAQGDNVKTKQIDSLLIVGFTDVNKGDINDAIGSFNKAYRKSSEINYRKGVAGSYRGMARTNYALNNLVETIKYSELSLNIYEELKDSINISALLMTIGVCYRDLGDLSRALKIQQKALKLNERLKDKNSIAYSYSNIGILYAKQKNWELAAEYTKKAILIREQMNDKIGLSTSYAIMGDIYFNNKTYSKSLEYLNKSLKLSREIGYPEKIKDVAEILYNLYVQQGNGKLALENYKLYIQMRDSLQNLENAKATVKQQMQHEFDKKQTADSLKVEEERKVTAMKFEQEKKQRWFLYGGLALVIVFAGFMVNRFRITQKQSKIIALQKKEVEEKHREITDSINYAERIQRSFLASKELLDRNLRKGTPQGNTGSDETDNTGKKDMEAGASDYFIFFKPKDVVSGDFYWAAEVQDWQGAVTGKDKQLPTANRRLFYLATADSTGHGVPGAIMSLLNISSLEKAIEHCSDPSEILNATREKIIERLKKDGSEDGGKDGMDCSLLAFDFKNMTLFIAAANNPVWIVRKTAAAVPEALEGPGAPAYELIEIKPDKMPVGKHDKQHIPFTLSVMDLQKGDVIYTLTDGFPDQFGGEKGKKFMIKNLREQLTANAHLPMDKQKQLLENMFNNWVGNLEQIDDVTVIGVKV